MKHDDRLDAWLTALRHEMAQACMARACEPPEKVMLGDDLPDDLPPDGGGLGPWRLSCAALHAKEISFCMVEHQKMRTTNIAQPAAKGW